MATGTLNILDVGHGNSAVLSYEGQVIVIDAGPKSSSLLEFLKHESISRVDYLLISHADQDHIAGITALVNNGIELGHVHLNSDSQKNTATWNDLTILLDENDRISQLDLTPTLFEEAGFIEINNLVIDILAPSKYLVLKGVGSTNRFGTKIGNNSISSVIKISLSDIPLAIFMGDIDTCGLEEIQHNQKDLKANILVYPHHGGLSGEGDDNDFVSKICRLVNFKEVVFSNGRGRYDNPKEEVIRKILEFSGDTYIACTQLSRLCSKSTPANTSAHINPRTSAGALENKCCAGTVSVDLAGNSIADAHKKAHIEFITNVVSNPLCKMKG